MVVMKDLAVVAFYANSVISVVHNDVTSGSMTLCNMFEQTSSHPRLGEAAFPILLFISVEQNICSMCSNNIILYLFNYRGLLSLF